MKHLRLIFMALLTFAFLATSTVAHVGPAHATDTTINLAHDVGSHSGHHDVAVHGDAAQKDGHHDYSGHGDGHCCTLGGCGIVFAAAGFKFVERFTMIRFDACATSAGSILFPPEFPPPRELI